MPHEDDFAPDADGLQRALRLLVEARSRPGSPHVEPGLPLDLPERWPARGLGGGPALDLLAAPALDRASRLDHPGFLAHMDPPTPWMTWAATMWAAAMNQNVLHPDAAPTARQLEALVVGWLAPAFGMNGGHLLPGSTVANLTALWAARDLTGARRVVCSTAAHLSVGKAARILGLELVEVPVDDAQRLRTDLLPDDLSDAIVVLIAGTVATGAVDPLDAAPGAAWRHVDAAWAGPLRLSSHSALLDGVQTADSVAVSAHKWLYQPKDSALVLFRDVASAHDAVSSGGSYLAAPNVGLLGSHGNTALPLVATLLAWGRDGLAARIDADMATAQRLADLVQDCPDLELWRRPVTGVVNWRPRHQSAEQVRARLRDAWVSTALVDGDTWFRSVAANPLADPERVVGAVLRALHGAADGAPRRQTGSVTDPAELPAHLPAPIDDGAADHLPGARLPDVVLASSDGRTVGLADLGPGVTVLYVYPLTARPGTDPPTGWDTIPGARGCTPEACAFRDHHADLLATGASAVHGISSQTTEYQREVVQRLRLPFTMLADPDFLLATALGLPTFTASGQRLYRRLTMLVRDGVVEHVFYPVLTPDQHAEQVLSHLAHQDR